jgi:hypothetical protein
VLALGPWPLLDVLLALLPHAAMSSAASMGASTFVV